MFPTPSKIKRKARRAAVFTVQADRVSRNIQMIAQLLSEFQIFVLCAVMIVKLDALMVTRQPFEHAYRFLPLPVIKARGAVISCRQ